MRSASPLLRLGASLLAALLVALPPAGGPVDPLADRGWTWPTAPVRMLRPFVAPAHAYGPGHRGLDLGGDGDVRAPADGRVAFAGRVAERSVLTIDHGDGLVSSFEPVDTDLAVGEVVGRTQIVGRVSDGGHAGAGSLHFGVRLDGEYINPLRLLGGVPRAVLLPCCEPLADRGG
ncbi:murein hydrolase activator EnvC family protein [Microbacterium sp. NPDC090007]|uniref:murein hydrolase activator EnvC family protein n=1 Tax=Microbacterium sp. NPDC090007 TaxID=3364204 RepID=UPI0038274A98